jgi:hypothetical protein
MVHERITQSRRLHHRFEVSRMPIVVHWSILLFFSKRKVRGLFGFWTNALYSIDIDHFETFLKQQKKDAKQAVKNPNSNVATNAEADPDEDVPDIDPTHEQLNLPANSITLWRIIPKLDCANQVSDDMDVVEHLVIDCIDSVLQFLVVHHGIERVGETRSTDGIAVATDGLTISTGHSSNGRG